MHGRVLQYARKLAALSGPSGSAAVAAQMDEVGVLARRARVRGELGPLLGVIGPRHAICSAQGNAVKCRRASGT